MRWVVAQRLSHICAGRSLNYVTFARNMEPHVIRIAAAALDATALRRAVVAGRPDCRRRVQPDAGRGARLGDEYLPVRQRLLLSRAPHSRHGRGPGAFYEFDPKIHAPEGSLLTWPWGYDYAMAWLVRPALVLGIADTADRDPDLDARCSQYSCRSD